MPSVPAAAAVSPSAASSSPAIALCLTLSRILFLVRQTGVLNLGNFSLALARVRQFRVRRFAVLGTALDVLLSARELLVDELRWVRDAGSEGYAVDVNGNGCDPTGPAAVRWELFGAVDVTAERYKGALWEDAFWEALGHVAVAIDRIEVTPWSRSYVLRTIDDWHRAPDRSHADVLVVLDAAIARARGGDA